MERYNKLGILIYTKANNGFRSNSIDHFYDKKRTTYQRIINIIQNRKIVNGIFIIKKLK